MLKHNLNTLCISPDQFRRDHLHRPKNLQDLVEQGYLRQLRLDPITNKNDSWTVNNDEHNKIIYVHSGSSQKSLEGSTYAAW